MADPALPSDLMDTIRDLQRRLERVELSSRLTSASMKNGTIRILDGAGAERVILGLDADGDYGLTIKNATGRVVFHSGNLGTTVPTQYLTGFQNAGLVPGTALASTASATFTELLRVDVYATAPTIRYDFMGLLSTGTVEHQITLQEAGASGSPTVVAGPWSSTVGTQRVGSFTIPAAALISGTGTDPAGRKFVLRVEGRSVSGGGLAYAAPISFSSP